MCVSKYWIVVGHKSTRLLLDHQSNDVLLSDLRWRSPWKISSLLDGNKNNNNNNDHTRWQHWLVAVCRITTSEKFWLWLDQDKWHFCAFSTNTDMDQHNPILLQLDTYKFVSHRKILLIDFLILFYLKKIISFANYCKNIDFLNMIYVQVLKNKKYSSKN